jgi:hypothetical protein
VGVSYGRRDEVNGSPARLLCSTHSLTRV